jgi:hypothetical protein
MDMLTFQELKTLSETKFDFLISIFLPTHRSGRETEQDPIRFKNLLNDAEKRLLDEGVRRPEVETLLRPAKDLLLKSDFWRYTSDGLALFLSSDVFKTYRLPVLFDQIMVISSQFHLKPLLPFFATDGHFYILSISQNQIRLFEGTQHTIDEIIFEVSLPNLAEAMNFDQFSKELQFHTGASASKGGESAGMFHGHHPKDDDKKRLLQWFKKVDEALSSLLVNEKSPLVLASVDYLIPIYKDANSYPYFVEKSIAGNPEELTPKAIHEKAWSIVSPIFVKEELEATEKYHQLKTKQLTANTIDEILFSAHHGRIEMLFVALGEQIWGQYDFEKQQLQVHLKQESGDHDLLNIAALQTMLNGGTVYAVKHEKVPDDTLMAAIFRY